MQCDRRMAVNRRSFTAHLRKFVVEKDCRIADLDCSVHDAPIRHGMAAEFLRAKSALVEIDGLRRTVDYQVWRDGMHAFRNWFLGWGHSAPFNKRLRRFAQEKNYTPRQSSQLAA